MFQASLNANVLCPLRINAMGNGYRTHQTDMMVPTGKKLYYFLFLVLTVSSGTFGYAFMYVPCNSHFLSEEIGYLVKKCKGSHGGQSQC